jgi:DNA-binding transcriptional MerR regulator
MSNVHRLPIVGAPPAERPSSRQAAAIDGAAAERLLRVGDLARACGKTVRAIHHYEAVGLLKPHARSKGRYRLYAADAVARVRWIGKLNDLGMSLSAIQRILGLWEESASAPAAMAKIRGIYLEKLREVHAQIERLAALEREVIASIGYLDTCEICDPHELVDACSGCTVHDASQRPEPDLVAGLYACRSAGAGA